MNTTTLLTLSNSLTRWWVLLAFAVLFPLLYVRVARYRMDARARADTFGGLGKNRKHPDAKVWRARWMGMFAAASGSRAVLRVFGALFALHALGRFVAFVAHALAGWAR